MQVAGGGPGGGGDDPWDPSKIATVLKKAAEVTTVELGEDDEVPPADYCRTGRSKGIIWFREGEGGAQVMRQTAACLNRSGAYTSSFFMHACVHTCMHIHVYAYIYIYIYIYVFSS